MSNPDGKKFKLVQMDGYSEIELLDGETLEDVRNQLDEKTGWRL